MSLLFDDGGAPLELHARVGEGGEATVRHVAGRDGVLAKVYKDADDLDQHVRKVVALVAMASPGLEKVAVWPRQLVVDSSGQAVGFLMEHLKGWTPLFSVYQTRSRLRQMPQGDWGFLVRVARNLATAVATVHRAGLVIGDLNESNVLVSGQAMVKLIDVDSFQVEVDGTVMACPVGKAEYLAPELQGRDLEAVRRNQRHDLFALAVLVFQTLMLGRHPFAGRPCGGLEPTLEQSVANHWYAHTTVRDVPLRPPPGVTTTWLPPLVQTLFERAFGTDASARPTAKVWAESLRELEQDLTACSPGHVYWSGLAACPWCRIERRSRMRVFGVPVDAKGTVLTTADEALAELAEAAARAGHLPALVQTTVPAEAQVNNLSPIPVSALSEAEARERRRDWILQVGRTCAVLVVGGVAVVAAGAGTEVGMVMGPLGVVLAYPALFFQAGRRARRVREVRAERASLRAEIEQLGEAWEANPVAAELAGKRAQLDELLRDAGRAEEKRSEIRDRYLARSYGNEVNQFLSKYSVLVADVKDLSARRLNALYEQGLRTAADIVPGKLEVVSDLDQADRDQLLAWRERMARQFWRSGGFSLPPETEDLADREFTAWVRDSVAKITDAERAIRVLTEEVENTQRSLASRMVAVYERARVVERAYEDTKHAIVLGRRSVTQARK